MEHGNAFQVLMHRAYMLAITFFFWYCHGRALCLYLARGRLSQGGLIFIILVVIG